MRALLRLIDDQADTRLPYLTLSQVEKAYRAVAVMDPAQRLHWSRSDRFDAAALVPALCFMRHLLYQFGLDRVTIPMVRLRDGLLADCLPGAPGSHYLSRTDLLAAARRLARRYGTDAAYARNTASICRQIFKQTAAIHQLDARAGTLLEFAAWVHDIGAWINVRSRHKHTFYVLSACDIAGISADEKSVIAHVARYHRGNPPLPSHAAFQRLPRPQRVLISYLAAILRVAYALDVERTQRIRSIDCRVVGGQLLISVDAQVVALERWSMERKSNLFRDVFGLDVTVVSQGNSYVDD